MLVALVVLLPRFPRNWWLIGVALFAGWHLLEHAVIMATYFRPGVVGSPLALRRRPDQWGLPLARPDLHFLYNLGETIPLLIGWRGERKRV